MKVAPGKEADHADWHAKNTDPYGAGVIRYGELWAAKMEACLASGKSLESCVEETSHQADVEGITGFMFGCAVNFLWNVWAHGDELMATSFIRSRR
jgi:hypothetical protein